MSVMQTPRVNPLQFFRSSPAPCPYLPGRVERKLFARLSGPDTGPVNSLLSGAGFRRSHDIIYRPACPSCQACVPVRVPVAQFQPSENLEKISRRGQQLSIHVLPCEATPEQFDLFARYQNVRHGESDMARMSYDDYVAMLREGQADTFILEARRDPDTLLGVMLADRLQDGFSAVYSFYAPEAEAARYSLGTLLILQLIARAAATGLPYVYLGYWVEGSPKMDYKSRFRPLQSLVAGAWVETIPASPHSHEQ